jgi:hypothetical protein
MRRKGIKTKIKTKETNDGTNILSVHLNVAFPWRYFIILDWRAISEMWEMQVSRMRPSATSNLQFSGTATVAEERCLVLISPEASSINPRTAWTPTQTLNCFLCHYWFSSHNRDFTSLSRIVTSFTTSPLQYAKLRFLQWPHAPVLIFWSLFRQQLSKSLI